MIFLGEQQVGLNSALDGEYFIVHVESSSTASKSYVIGSYLIYNNILYKVTAVISVGDTLAAGTNITAVSNELTF